MFGSIYHVDLRAKHYDGIRSVVSVLLSVRPRCPTVVFSGCGGRISLLIDLQQLNRIPIRIRDEGPTQLKRFIAPGLDRDLDSVALQSSDHVLQVRHLQKKTMVIR